MHCIYYGGNINDRKTKRIVAQSTRHRRSRSLSYVWYIYDAMDVYDTMVDIIPLEVSYRDQIKVYMIQLVCYGVIL